MQLNKKIMIITALCGAMISLQSFVQKHDDEKAQNLKILPKDISGQELHKIMRDYSMALGVRCNFCHVAEKVEGQERPKMDFASDAKPEKKTARDMMLMVTAINKDYLAKASADHKLEPITCVTCHMGRTTPIITTDSLTKK